MDKKHPGSELVDEAVAATEPYGLAWKPGRIARNPGPGTDGTLRLAVGEARAIYEVEVKRHVSDTTVGRLALATGESKRPLLLVADHVTPHVASRLIDAGIQFIDTAGNVSLQGKGYLVRVLGQAKSDRRPRKTDRAFTAGGLKVILALLESPALAAAAYREIAEAAGVAHGTVGWAMPDLERLGFIATVRGKRRIVQRERLLGQWADAYVRVLRPKLFRSRYDGPIDRNWTREGYALSGDLAAAVLDDTLQPGSATLYGPRMTGPALARLRIAPAAAGPIELLESFWPARKEVLAPLPVVYADLLREFDARTEPAVKRVREQILDRPDDAR